MTRLGDFRAARLGSHHRSDSLTSKSSFRRGISTCLPRLRIILNDMRQSSRNPSPSANPTVQSSANSVGGISRHMSVKSDHFPSHVYHS
jgi:hypothetical protein